MKIRVASDLHFEFHADGGVSLAQELAQGDFDMLVIAGDLSSFGGLRSALKILLRSDGSATSQRPILTARSRQEISSLPTIASPAKHRTAICRQFLRSPRKLTCDERALRH